MTLYFRSRSLPELAGLSDEEAATRATEAQQRLGLKPSLLSAALFGGSTLLGGVLGHLAGYQLVGTGMGWAFGMWLFTLVKINASRPMLAIRGQHDVDNRMP